MKIVAIAGFASITRDVAASRRLYFDTFALPFRTMNDYAFVDRFPGCQHFGIWPLEMAAEACFGRPDWPPDVPVPQATIEFELADVESVTAAVGEMQAAGQAFVHEARTEPWGQTIARFVSPEGLLVGLSFAPWLHEPRDA